MLKLTKIKIIYFRCIFHCKIMLTNESVTINLEKKFIVRKKCILINKKCKFISNNKTSFGPKLTALYVHYVTAHSSAILKVYLDIFSI